MEIHKCSFENAQISFFRNVFDKTMYEVIDLQPNIQGYSLKKQTIYLFSEKYQYLFLF